jgi:hypothetical protein
VAGRRAPRSARPVDPGTLRADPEIDARYGLEPVFEPGRDPRQIPLDAQVGWRCPHCGARDRRRIELVYSELDLIEDCSVCCRPLRLRGRVDRRGQVRLAVSRLDESG